nr:helix-turn-helix domain-containing protein [Paenibacillus sp. ATY16]
MKGIFHVHEVILRFDQVLKIKEFGFHTTNNLYTHPSRMLDFDVFLFVAEGQMEVWEEGLEYIVKKGQFLFLKSGMSHWGEPKTPAGTSWYWIHFFGHLNGDGDTLHDLNSNKLFASPTVMDAQEDYRKSIALPKHGTLSQTKGLENKLDALIQLFHSSDPFRALSLSLQTMELYLKLYQESMKEHPPTKSDRTVLRIIDYLENKNNYEINSKELAASLDMNYSYLCEIFKLKTGSTIHGYNARLFMNKAIGLMKDSERNVSEISDLLGFKNPFYFSRVFRKIMGCSPSEYMSRTYRK